MEKSYFIAGFGGQGVQTIGTLLVYAINEIGRFATFLPEYAGTQRGGVSNCTIMMSNEQIGAFAAREYDNTVLLSAEAYKAYKKTAKVGGILFVNSSLIEGAEEPEGVRLVKIPLNDMAKEAGSALVVNVIMLGFLARYIGDIPVETMKEVMLDKMGSKKKYLETNIKAFELGVKKAGELLNSK